MHSSVMMTKKEELYLSLSPFTIPELFHTNVHQSILPYLSEEKKMIVPKNYVFYETEEIAEKLFYLKKGVVIESLLNENGLEKDFLSFPSYLVGFHYCAHEQPIFPCTKAFTECEVYLFGYGELLGLMQKDRKLLQSIIKILSLDFRMANSLALQNQSCSSYEKVCQILLSYFIVSKYNGQARKLKMTQQLIAGLAGIHRISVVHAVQRLKKENIIAYTNKTIEVLNYEKLQCLAYGKYSIQ